MRILLTGFEPFGGETMNPSMAVVEALAPRPPPGIELETLVLPVDRARAADAVLSRLGADGPPWVLMLGEAGGRARITPERIAINVDSYRIPDNAGHQPVDEPVVRGGPAAYFSSLPLEPLVAGLRSAGIPAAVSNSAGTFLCNHVFYALMHRAREQALPVRGGFVHLPYAHGQVMDRDGVVPSLSVETMTRGVALMLEVLRDAPPA